MHLLALFKISLLASITVSLWTVRVALTARGRRYAGALVAVVEAMTFATMFAEVLDSVDSPTRLSAYGIGVGAGTLAGLAIDQRIRLGSRTASRHHRDALRRPPSPDSDTRRKLTTRSPNAHVRRDELRNVRAICDADQRSPVSS